MQDDWSYEAKVGGRGRQLDRRLGVLSFYVMMNVMIVMTSV